MQSNPQRDLSPLRPAARWLAVTSLSAIGWLAAAVLPARGQASFDNQVVTFEVDTIVEFEFVISNGAYQSTFGVLELDENNNIIRQVPLISEDVPSDFAQSVERPSDYQTDIEADESVDFRGTPGITVPEPFAEFLFEAGKRYAFYLESTFEGRDAGTVYSLDALNVPTVSPDSPGVQLFRFLGGLSELEDGTGILIDMDDTGAQLVRDTQQDRDFDDFRVVAGGNLSCPY